MRRRISLRHVLVGMLAAMSIGATTAALQEPGHSEPERPKGGRLPNDTTHIAMSSEHIDITSGDAPSIYGAIADVGNPPDAYTAAADVDIAVAAYLTALEAERIENERKWAEGVARARAELAAAAQSRPRASGYHPGTTVGACTGFAIPDYIIQAESGGNPSAYNPSGAYGCAQTLLSHYSSGSCSGLDPYTIEGQRECVVILSDGGTNLDPWAATR